MPGDVPLSPSSSFERRVEVPIDPLEARVDLVLADDLVNRRDRGEPRVPDGLRVVASEPLDELGEARVGHHRQVRAGMPRVGHRAAIAFEHDDAFAGLREQVGRGETGHPAADDDDVGLGIVGELGKLRKRRRRRPVRCGVMICSGIVVPFSVRLGMRRMDWFGFRRPSSRNPPARGRRECRRLSTRAAARNVNREVASCL